jgi:hypothetical protein
MFVSPLENEVGNAIVLGVNVNQNLQSVQVVIGFEYG